MLDTIISYVKSHAKAVVAAVVAVVVAYITTGQADESLFVAVLTAAGVHLVPNT